MGAGENTAFFATQVVGTDGSRAIKFSANGSTVYFGIDPNGNFAIKMTNANLGTSPLFQVTPLAQVTLGLDAPNEAFVLIDNAGNINIHAPTKILATRTGIINLGNLLGNVDPHVIGQLWNNAGVLQISDG